MKKNENLTAKRSEADSINTAAVIQLMIFSVVKKKKIKKSLNLHVQVSQNPKPEIVVIDKSAK